MRSSRRRGWRLRLGPRGLGRPRNLPSCSHGHAWSRVVVRASPSRVVRRRHAQTFPRTLQSLPHLFFLRRAPQLTGSTRRLHVEPPRRCHQDAPRRSREEPAYPVLTNLASAPRAPEPFDDVLQVRGAVAVHVRGVERVPEHRVVARVAPSSTESTSSGKSSRPTPPSPWRRENARARRASAALRAKPRAAMFCACEEASPNATRGEAIIEGLLLRRGKLGWSKRPPGRYPNVAAPSRCSARSVMPEYAVEILAKFESGAQATRRAAYRRAPARAGVAKKTSPRGPRRRRVARPGSFARARARRRSKTALHAQVLARQPVAQGGKGFIGGRGL